MKSIALIQKFSFILEQISLLIILILLNPPIYSQKLSNNCPVTKPSTNNYAPEIFHTSNNLLRSEGDILEYNTNIITLKGTLRDKNCAPIQDAKIYLWQVDQKGKYCYKILRNKFKNHGVKDNPVELFQGSGISSTDNEGSFSFITIFPGSFESEHPHVNLLITHPTLGSLQTKLYLKQYRSNISSIQDRKLNGYPLSTPDKDNVYRFQIILSTEKNYRRY